MTTRQSLIALLLPVALAFGAASAAEPSSSRGTVEHGRYLVRTSGCNDCHTPGYAEKDGKIPERDWLTGNPVGFQGPWGTTYPVNLRLLVQSLTEREWTRRVRGAARPPMPWISLNSMTDRDLHSIYRFVRSLGAAGKPAPEFVPPGKTVTTPYIEFFPKNLPKQAQTH
jgi:mono/diheme cytochrome c family protein